MNGGGLLPFDVVSAVQLAVAMTVRMTKSVAVLVFLAVFETK